MRYIIQDRQAGNIIEVLSTYEEAQSMLEEFERQDEEDGIYEADFYEIVEVE